MRKLTFWLSIIILTTFALLTSCGERLPESDPKPMRMLGEVVTVTYKGCDFYLFTGCYETSAVHSPTCKNPNHTGGPK